VTIALLFRVASFALLIHVFTAIIATAMGMKMAALIANVNSVKNHTAEIVSLMVAIVAVNSCVGSWSATIYSMTM
jgi:hypothetical protein